MESIKVRLYNAEYDGGTVSKLQLVKNVEVNVSKESHVIELIKLLKLNADDVAVLDISKMKFLVTIPFYINNHDDVIWNEQIKYVPIKDVMFYLGNDSIDLIVNALSCVGSDGNVYLEFLEKVMDAYTELTENPIAKLIIDDLILHGAKKFFSVIKTIPYKFASKNATYDSMDEFLARLGGFDDESIAHYFSVPIDKAVYIAAAFKYIKDNKSGKYIKILKKD